MMLSWWVILVGVAMLGFLGIAALIAVVAIVSKKSRGRE